jgi:hypothetical protein
MLKGDSPANKFDEDVRKRIDYGLGLLEQYSKALSQVRESGAINHKDFPYGL